MMELPQVPQGQLGFGALLKGPSEVSWHLYSYLSTKQTHGVVQPAVLQFPNQVPTDWAAALNTW